MKILKIFIILLIFSLIKSQNISDYSEDYYSEETEVNENSIDFSRFQKLFDELFENHEKSETSVQTVNQTIGDLLHLHSLFARSFDTFYKTFFPLVSEFIQKTSISGECLSTLISFVEDLRQQKEWPLKFLDSSARIPFSGLFLGTISDFGEYDECLAIKETLTSGAQVRGQYCMIRVSLRLPPKPEKLSFFDKMIDLKGTPLSDTFWVNIEKNVNLFYIARGLRFGLCLPDTCSARDLNEISSKLLEPILRLEIKFPTNCESILATNDWTPKQRIALSILVIMSSMVLISTLVNSIDSKTHIIFKSFSMTNSARNLFKTNTQTKRLAVIHGLRVVSIAWILLGHVYLMQFFQIFHVLRNILKDMPRLAWIRYQPLKLGAFLQVDTFLLLGGVTASYVLMDVLPSVGRFDYFAFLAFRWLRYSPALLGTILLYFLLPHASSGPIFRQNIELQSQTCEHFWWRNLLYINNFFDAKGNCATHTWYLAVDFQLYALSPLLVFTLRHNQTLGVALCLLVILGGALLAVLAPLIDPTLWPSMYSLSTLLSEDSIYYHFRHLYWSSLQHISPYFMGTLLGFFVHKYPKIEISRRVESLVWTLCLFSGIGTIFWTTSWMDSTQSEEFPSRAHRLLFTAIHKITWTVLPAWIVFSSAFGRPGPIGRFLSSGYWVPLSRLTYGIYLVQLIPIVLRAYSVRHVQPFDDYYNLSVWLMCLVLSVALSFIIFIVFESPFSQLMKIIKT